MTRKKYFILVTLLIILFTSIIMVGYYHYNVHVRGMTITNIKKIQENYPQYMVDMNDEFISYMIEFEDLMKDPKREFSDEELSKISENLTKQNSVMVRLQKNPPNTSNKDYLTIYKDYLKLYAFFIQGEIMRFEFVSNYKTEYTQEEVQEGLIANEENYIIGVELCNMIGTLILENPIIVNRIHNTNAQSQYNVMPLDEWKETVTKKIEEYENSLENEETSMEEIPAGEESSIVVQPELTIE